MKVYFWLVPILVPILFKIGKLTQADSIEIVTGKEPCTSVRVQVLMLQGFGVQPRGRFLTNLKR